MGAIMTTLNLEIHPVKFNGIALYLDYCQTPTQPSIKSNLAQDNHMRKNSIKSNTHEIVIPPTLLQISCLINISSEVPLLHPLIFAVR